MGRGRAVFFKGLLPMSSDKLTQKYKRQVDYYSEGFFEYISHRPRYKSKQPFVKFREKETGLVWERLIFTLINGQIPRNSAYYKKLKDKQVKITEEEIEQNFYNLLNDFNNIEYHIKHETLDLKDLIERNYFNKVKY